MVRSKPRGMKNEIREFEIGVVKLLRWILECECSQQMDKNLRSWETSGLNASWVVYGTIGSSCKLPTAFSRLRIKDSGWGSGKLFIFCAESSLGFQGWGIALQHKAWEILRCMCCLVPCTFLVVCLLVCLNKSWLVAWDDFFLDAFLMSSSAVGRTQRKFNIFCSVLLILVRN